LPSSGLKFPVLAAYINVIAGSVTERDVFVSGLRNLIAAAEPTSPGQRPHPPS
jgi:hypothetical protein